MFETKWDTRKAAAVLALLLVLPGTLTAWRTLDGARTTDAATQMPTPVPLSCNGLALGAQLFAYHAVVLDLPAGQTYVFTGQSGAQGNWAQICIPAFNSSIIFDSQTGREIQRYVNDARAAPVLNQIARDITLNAMPTPVAFVTPPSGPPAPVTRGAPISPPNTGDAGLPR